MCSETRSKVVESGDLGDRDVKKLCNIIYSLAAEYRVRTRHSDKC